MEEQGASGGGWPLGGGWPQRRPDGGWTCVGGQKGGFGPSLANPKSSNKGGVGLSLASSTSPFGSSALPPTHVQDSKIPSVRGKSPAPRLWRGAFPKPPPFPAGGHGDLHTIHIYIYKIYIKKNL